MIRRIYHGSDHIIEKPEYGYGKPYNDYGLGFYCTENIDMAKEWAVSDEQDGFANIYDLDMDGLTVLDLNDDSYTVMNWLAVLLENRTFDVPAGLPLEAKRYITGNFMPDYKNYDIVTGLRADDSYFSFAQDFINGTISYQSLGKAMHLGKMGTQTVLKSQLAFDRIKYIGNEIADHEEWYEKKTARDNSARQMYFNQRTGKWQKGELYIIQILDEEIKQDDPRLR
ncbi:MAG: DUF3990 domain-containing protein [Lachnospiraceae bacterium]|nr:DUF3990 domain-containing protein [Lachnospiraceae bacterium]